MLALRQGGNAMADYLATTKPTADTEKPPPSAAARRKRRRTGPSVTSRARLRARRPGAAAEYLGREQG